MLYTRGEKKPLWQLHNCVARYTEGKFLAKRDSKQTVKLLLYLRPKLASSYISPFTFSKITIETLEGVKEGVKYLQI